MIHLIAHLFRDVKATFRDAVERRVECERCSTRFRYTMTRTGIGKSTGLAFGDNASSNATAADRARRDAARRLEREADVVPCPKCAWINRDAVVAYRRGRYRFGVVSYLAWTFGAFFVPMMAGAGVVGLAATMEQNRPRGSHATPAETAAMIVGGAAMVVGLLAPLVVLAARWLLRRRIDPNRMSPPTLPPDTPTATIERSGAAVRPAPRA